MLRRQTITGTGATKGMGTKHVPPHGPSRPRMQPMPGLLPAKGEERVPVLHVDRNAIVLEANGTGRSLLDRLGRGVGERLPDYLNQFVPGVLLSGSAERLAVELDGAPLAFTVAMNGAPEAAPLHNGKWRHQALVLVEPENSEAAVLHALPVALYTSTARGEFAETWISPGVEQLTGYSPSDFVKKRGFRISRVHPEDRTAVIGALRSLRSSGRSSVEYRLLCADGSYRWVLDQSVRVPGEEKVFGIMQDINARKRCEGSLRRTNEFMEMMIAGAAHGVMVLDQDMRLHFMNPSLAGKMGFKSSDWVKRHIRMRFHPLDGETGRATLSDALAGSAGQCEVRLRTQAGSYKYFQLCVTPLEWRGQKLVLAVASDISRRKMAEKKREASYQRGLDDIVTSAFKEFAPGLGWKEAIDRLKKRLGAPGRELIKALGRKGRS